MTIDPADSPDEADGHDDFPLWPYLDTLYRWAETQPFFAAEADAAWKTFVANVPTAPKDMPDAQDPDQHDRVLRFWAWFALDRPSGDGRKPLDRFLGAHLRDLTADGKLNYEGLGGSAFGIFKVLIQFRQPVLEDLSTNKRYRLAEGGLAAELVAGDMVAGRLYPYDEDTYIADPDVHIGHMIEAGAVFVPADAPAVEARFFGAQVPAKGQVLDVLDALLLQVDSPLTADDVFEMIRGGSNLEEVLDELYAAPAYRLRYLHLRDRSLIDELMQELWDTSGPLEDAKLAPADATALARTVREGLRAIAEGNAEALLAIADPKGFFPLYLEFFGMKGIQRLADVTHGAPDTAIRTKHQLLPKDGGIFTTLTWSREGEKHATGMVAYGTTEGKWHLSDLSPPEAGSPALMLAFERAQNLGWVASEPPDAVEGLLRKAVGEVGYSVHDTIDLFRLWRDFKAAADPDLAQPAIWAAGVELADIRYRNEDVDVKVLAKSYGVMPRAIEAAAAEIDGVMQKLQEEEEAANKP